MFRNFKAAVVERRAASLYRYKVAEGLIKCIGISIFYHSPLKRG